MATIRKTLSGQPALPGSGAGWTWFADLPGTAFPGLLDRLLLWQERAAQRSALAALEDRDLRDVGLSRADVEAEVSKPFWRA